MDKFGFTFLNQIVYINVTLRNSSVGKETAKSIKWKDATVVFLTTLL